MTVLFDKDIEQALGLVRNRAAEKEFICPLCKHKSIQKSNSSELIQSIRCDICDSRTLFCWTPENQKHFYSIEKKEIPIIHYRIDFDTPDRKQDKWFYQEMCEMLTGVHRFRWFVRGPYITWIRKHTHVSVWRTENTPENQMESTIGRLHLWSEFIVPRCTIKRGYYLDTFGETDEKKLH